MTLRVIRFTADWCGPCRALEPVWDKIVSTTAGVDFEVVDIDKDAATASSMSVRSIPTIVFIKDGLMVESLVGLQKEVAIREKIEVYK